MRLTHWLIHYLYSFHHISTLRIASGELHVLNSTGSARAIAPSRDLILEAISVVKPSYMVSVPALMNKVNES